MDGYADFSMLDTEGNAVSGVCHARGINADLPPQWLMDIPFENLDTSLTACRNAGGNVLHGPRGSHGSKLAVIEDLAGAVR
jgi:predicted enzyme related to lactoylglutathione lyase